MLNSITFGFYGSGFFILEYMAQFNGVRSYLTNEDIINSAIKDEDALATALCFHQIRRVAERLRFIKQKEGIKTNNYSVHCNFIKNLFKVPMAKEVFLNLMNAHYGDDGLEILASDLTKEIPGMKIFVNENAELDGIPTILQADLISKTRDSE